MKPILTVQSGRRHHAAPSSHRAIGPHKAQHNARRLSVIFALVLLAAVARLGPLAQGQSANSQAPKPWGQNPNGMRIYIWAGLKSHFPGQHDYPQFLADWSKILTEHGAVVDGALHAPSAADLAHTDVVIIYKGDAGYLSEEEKSALEAYVKRGGGLVSLHDSLCGPDPAYFATSGRRRQEARRGQLHARSADRVHSGGFCRPDHEGHVELHHLSTKLFTT